MVEGSFLDLCHSFVEFESYRGMQIAVGNGDPIHSDHRQISQSLKEHMRIGHKNGAIDSDEDRVKLQSLYKSSSLVENIVIARLWCL